MGDPRAGTAARRQLGVRHGRRDNDLHLQAGTIIKHLPKASEMWYTTSRQLGICEGYPIMKDNKWKCPKCGRSFSRTGQGHYCGKVETIDEYIDAQDESVKPYLNEIRQILRSAIPEAQEKISWSMPTYWKGANIIHFAASKKHIGLYPGDEAPVVFADQLAGYDVSKGTIRIPYISPLPKDLIANIARWCYEEYRK